MKRFLLAISGPVRPCLFAASVAFLSVLTACGGGGGGGGADGGDIAQAASVTPDASILQFDARHPGNWELGPIIEGRNHSVGVPPYPSVHAAGGWVIDLPYPNKEAGSVHYVTMKTGSLAAYSKVTMTFRVEADPGVKILPRNFPEQASMLTLYFQREGDDWSAKGAYEAYRWYARFSTRTPLEAGEYTVEAPFDRNWTALMTSSRTNNLAGFEGARAHAGRVGFVLGGGDGVGHGVYATGKARIVVTSFKLE